MSIIPVKPARIKEHGPKRCVLSRSQYADAPLLTSSTQTRAGRTVRWTARPQQSFAVWDTANLAAGPIGTDHGLSDTCGSGGPLLLTPSSEVWLAGAGAICKVAADASASPVVTSLPVSAFGVPLDLCLGSDGNVWYMRTDGLVRVVPSAKTSARR